MTAKPLQSYLLNVPSGSGGVIRSTSIAIVILNWNGRDDTLACLESMRKVDYLDFNIIVVDNGSSDDSVDTIQSAFPEVEILQTGKNLGYAGGNNAGIRMALMQGAGYILLLNNDTVVDPGFLKEMVKASAQMADNGVFSPAIYYFSKPKELWYAGTKWDSGHLQYEHITNTDTLKVGDGAVQETGYACGCALFASNKVFRRVGLLEERFFLIYEEVDWCEMARKCGYSSYLVRRASVWHKVSASFGGATSPSINYFGFRNYLLWAERHLSRAKRIRILFRLMREIFHEIWDMMSSGLVRPPSILGFFTRDYYWNVISHKRVVFRRWDENIMLRAKILGIRDYFLRRFGNPQESLALIRRKN